jgi:hypothetical protein
VRWFGALIVDILIFLVLIPGVAITWFAALANGGSWPTAPQIMSVAGDWKWYWTPALAVVVGLSFIRLLLRLWKRRRQSKGAHSSFGGA